MTEGLFMPKLKIAVESEISDREQDWGGCYEVVDDPERELCSLFWKVEGISMCGPKGSIVNGTKAPLS